MNNQTAVRRCVAIVVFLLSFNLAGQLGGGALAQGTSGAPAGGPTAGARRSITEKDLFDFTWIGTPQLSPDGSRVAFTRVVVDDKRKGYETSIWMVATGGNQEPVRLTSGKHDAGPRWSPDGRSIGFVRAGDKDDSGKPRPPQIALLSLAGGEARIVTDLPKGAGSPVWSPDSRHIAFTSNTNADDLAKQEKEKKPEPPGSAEAGKTAAPKPEAKPDAKSEDKADEHESDVQVITHAVYRLDEEGYLDYKRHDHIWVLDVPGASDDIPKARQVTFGNFDEGDLQWTPDGSRIYYLTQRVEEPYYELPFTEIFSVGAGGGEPQKFATVPMGIGDLKISPDGRRIAFHGAVTEPVRSYAQPDLWVMDLVPNAKPSNLTADYDFDMGDGVFGDNLAPRGGGGLTLHWSADGRSLFDVVGKQGRTILVRVDAQSGAITEITRGNQAVVDFTTTPDGQTVVALVSTPTMIGDLFLVSADGSQTRLTDMNQKLWSQLNLTEPEELNYISFDGMKMQAWIQKPPDFNPAKKYPLILNIHGGPHAAYGWVFDHEFQFMAAKGYVVLYPNPRGSITYGQEFGNIIQYHYPGDDYKDLMAGVDELVKRGYIDEKKLGVTGGSGGGVLTNWTVTHTDRFAAAVSQRDISNWAAWWYTADFTLFQANWFKAPPFQDPADYRDRSAITYVEKIHTPTMFVLGEEDYRAPAWSGGEQLFRALKYLKRPTAMVEFPGEGHELSRSGQPWHRIERLDYITGWFDKWMLGGKHPEFDVGQ
jgi:dipeptidyl aminopeptidase/acylaminoacyl peptidase